MPKGIFGIYYYKRAEMINIIFVLNKQTPTIEAMRANADH